MMKMLMRVAKIEVEFYSKGREWWVAEEEEGLKTAYTFVCTKKKKMKSKKHITIE